MFVLKFPHFNQEGIDETSFYCFLTVEFSIKRGGMRYYDTKDGAGSSAKSNTGNNRA